MALLETLVHVEDYAAIRQSFLLFALELASAQVQEVNGLPAHYDHPGQRQVLKALGDAWFDAGKSLALKVPAFTAPRAFNYLVNTEHPDFDADAIGPPVPFAIDPRL